MPLPPPGQQVGIGNLAVGAYAPRAKRELDALEGTNDFRVNANQATWPSYDIEVDTIPHGQKKVALPPALGVDAGGLDRYDILPEKYLCKPVQGQR